MSALLRAVFDTSSLVGAALQAASIPHRALTHVLAAGEVCASSATMTELEKVLARPKFDRYQIHATALAIDPIADAFARPGPRRV